VLVITADLVISGGLVLGINLIRVTLPLGWIEIEDDAPTEGFPWDLAVVRAIDRLEFTTPVTFLVGENGTGKSTLLEAIAEAANLNPEGGDRNLRFSARQTESDLHKELRLAWYARRERTFFLRAETFFNMASAYADLGVGGGDMGPLHDRSHGEQFLDIARRRFGPGGLFLMDEPESALSFPSQLALMRLMHEYSADGSQFIVATHSPILVTFPDATILLLHEDGIRPVPIDEAPPYRDTKAFLNAPGSYLHHLFTEN
jgi:predicted ATPase